MITNLLSISGIAYHDRSRVALGGSGDLWRYPTSHRRRQDPRHLYYKLAPWSTTCNRRLPAIRSLLSKYLHGTGSSLMRTRLVLASSPAIEWKIPPNADHVTVYELQNSKLEPSPRSSQFIQHARCGNHRLALQKYYSLI